MSPRGQDAQQRRRREDKEIWAETVHAETRGRGRSGQGRQATGRQDGHTGGIGDRGRQSQPLLLLQGPCSGRGRDQPSVLAGRGAGVPRRRKWGVGAQVLGWERREAVPGLRFVGLLLQGVGGLDSRGCERRGLGTGPRAPGGGWGAASGPPPGAGTGSRVPVAGRGGGGGRAPRTRERRGLGAQLPKFSEEEKPESQVPAPLKKAAGGP